MRAIYLFIAVCISLFAHEFAHMAFVHAFGGQVNGFKLSFLGATAWVRGLEKLKLWQRYAVYLAGPAANALIAFGVWVVARLFYLQDEFLQSIFLYNAVLCVFNLLPVFPLDGGRLVQLFLGNRIGVMRANRMLLKAGPIMGGGLIVLGFVQIILYPWNLTLLCAGIYIRRKNKQLPLPLYWECIQALQAKDKNNLRIKKIILPNNMPIKHAIEYLRWDYWVEIHIGGGRWISERELLDSIYNNFLIK